MTGLPNSSLTGRPIHSLRTINLKACWSRRWPPLFAKCAVISILLSVVVLGGLYTMYNVKEFQVLGSSVTLDLQFAAIGIINKVLDVLVTASFEDIAGTLVTVWMCHEEARLADFELALEMTKPWKAVSCFMSRWRAHGYQKARWLRLLLTLACSLCLMFLGLAENTVGIPKQRYWPSGISVPDIVYPRNRFDGDGAHWDHFTPLASGIVGNDSHAMVQSAIGTFTAASVFSSLQYFENSFRSSPRGWYQLSDSNYPAWAAVDTRYNGSTGRGLAVQLEPAKLVFKHLVADKSITRINAATGVFGGMHLVWPSLLVTCGDPINDPRVAASTTSFSAIKVPSSANSPTPPEFNISFSPFESFTGAECRIFLEMLGVKAMVDIPEESSGSIQTVLADGRLMSVHGSISALTFNDEDSITGAPPSTRTDTAIARRLATQLNATLPRLEMLCSDGENAGEQFLVDMARHLRSYRPEYTSEVEALAPIIASIVSQLVAIAQWNVTVSTTDFISPSNDLQFFVVGSGPRLAWEWAVTAIFLPLIAICLYGLHLTMWYGIAPGEWLKPAGMLFAAYNSGSNLDAINDAKSDKDVARQTLGIRIGDTNQAVSLVTEPMQERFKNRTLHLRNIYQWTEPQRP